MIEPKSKHIPIVDIFAGPGGLGEGFCSYERPGQKEMEQNPFSIAVSIERESKAHQTLKLRAFARTYLSAGDGLPRVYWDYVLWRDQQKNLRKRVHKTVPASLLGYMLHEETLWGLGEEALRSHLESDELAPIWEQFCNSYDDYEDLLTRVIETNKEAQRFELHKDTRDATEEIIGTALDRVGVNCDKPWVLIGGPPCQAYSNVGRSRRSGAKNKAIDQNESGLSHRNVQDDSRSWLYKEYLHIIAKFQPSVFVMENVKGMLSAEFDEGKKVWKQIIQDLNKPFALEKNDEESDCEYVICSLVDEGTRFGHDADVTLEDIDPHKFVIRAEQFDVPQVRERVILLGVRKDWYDRIGGELVEVLSSIDGTIANVGQAISDLPPLRSSLSSIQLSSGKNRKPTNIDSWHDIANGQIQDVFQSIKKLKESGGDRSHELDLASRFAGKLWAEHYKSSFLFSKLKTEWVNTNSVELSSENLKDYLFDLSQQPLLMQDANGAALTFDRNEVLASWYKKHCPELMVLNHSARGHMDTDIGRYMFLSLLALVSSGSEGKDRSMTTNTLAVMDSAGLDPKGHKNRSSFLDRFKVQSWHKPASTVVSHIAKDGHYFIHPDPVQSRSLTVREAARLQTFPNNYFFEGARTDQYIQVGNAVPPLLANKIAEVVYDIFSKFSSS